MAGGANNEDGAEEGGPAGGLAAVYVRYQNKLLSITKRNRSVLLRKIHHKHGCDLAVLERTTPGAATRVAPRAIKNALSGRPGQAGHTILSSSARGDDADRIRGRLKYLARNLGRMEEETGQQAGYLGFPFLVGRAAPDLYVRGPVALFPASLVPGQGSRAGGWAVQFPGQAPIVNSSLLMALKKRAQHPVPDDYEERFRAILEEMHDVEDSHEGHFLSKIGDWLQEFLPMDGAAGDPRSVEVAPLGSADLAAVGAEPLRLVNHKVFGSFPVADTKIYDDYVELIRRAGEPHHGLIASLLGAPPGGQGLGGAAAGPLGVEGGARADRWPGGASHAVDIDGAPSATLNTVLPSDSSQDAVILESQRSDVVVVRGPPGTGKSQVIVNLVSDALMRGEKVIVVCQKRAALEVVRQRLVSAGLGRYSVFLEREADDRLLMYRRLCDIIEGEPAGDGADGDIVGVAQGIDAHVKYLRDFGDALHTKVNGATAYDLYSRADGSYAAALDLDGVEGLPDWGGLDGYLDRMSRVEADVKRFDDPAGPWHGRKSFDALTHRDKGSIKHDMRLIREASSRSVLLGSREDQTRLVAALGSYAPAARPGPSASADIEKAICAGAGGATAADAAAAVLCAKMAGDMAEAQARASGARAANDREAGDALAEFAESYRLWDSAASLHRAAGDCMLVGGSAEQEALASALEALALRPGAGRQPPPAEIERAVRVGMGAGGATAADAAAAFCAKMAGDLARASGLDGRAASAPAEAVAAALSEFVGLCGSLARARALSKRAHGLLAGSLRDQEALVAALESYTSDNSIMKGRKKRAAREIAGMGLDPAYVVGGSGENAAGSLTRARMGLEFWRLLSEPPPPGDLERFCPVVQAAGRRSGVGPVLSGVERAIGVDMDSNGLSRWAKCMIRAGADSAQDGPARDRSAPIVQSYMDDPSPLRASAQGGADAQRRGAGPDGTSALRRAAEAALPRLVEGAAEPPPRMPNAPHYRRLAESVVSEFAGLCRASARVGRLARLATSCVLARSPGDQARLPTLYKEASGGGVLAGAKRRRAGEEIRAIVSIGPVDPGRAAEESERGSEFWAAWPEAESAAKELGIVGPKAFESRESLASHLGTLLRSIDEAMERSPLAGWAKRLHVAGAGAAVSAPADGPAAAGAPGRTAPAAAPLDGLPRELCGELAIVEPGAGDPAAAAAAEAGRYAADLARASIEPVRRGVEFWPAYSALRGRIGASPGGEPDGPEEALDEVRRTMDESLRRVEQSPVSEWAKALATSRSLQEDAASGASERRADAEKVARLYLADPGLLAAERRAGGPPEGEPDAALMRAMFNELDKKGAMPELPAMPGADEAARYEAMIADALSSPRGGGALAEWARMIMGCALPCGPDGPPDPRSIPAERAASPGFIELEEGDPLSRMACNMREAAERAAAGGLHAAEEGIRVWDAFERIGGFFGPGARAGPSAGRVAPGDIESFAADAMPALEADALDDIQELDKKKLEYEPSIFALLEMARAAIGRGEDWTAAVRREIYAHWLDGIERAHPILAGRPLDNYNSHADGLAALAESKRGLVAREISRRIESARPADIYGKPRTLFAPGNLRAWKAMLGELKKKRRVMPVRRLIERYSDQLFRIAPCWLASPESISKALPLSRGLFDLAIVDEASQLAMERTIPFLYRAKRTVIAGDENQLPPFDLFQARDDGGEEYDEDAEAEQQYDEKSLLDLARVKHTAVNLTWHYRSRHQVLIDFSNHAFYGGSLNVVPDARSDPARPPIRWVDCDGTWDDHVNDKEAAEAVRQVRMAWAGAATSGRDLPTVGVITFNEAQQNLILDNVEAARASDGEFARLYDLAHEGGRRDAGLFVKNIENVQGDERDVIIFSVGYARDANGRFSNRFGPLNLKGGENRLNVAVTRARESMVVVSSIDPSMISESSAHDGPRRFRQFLEYARAVGRMDAGGQADVLARLDDASGAGGRAGAGAGAGPGSAGDALGSRVRKALEGAGYRVETGLGFSGYRIDLAVVDPRDENRYAVGIEYDGPTFRSARSVMERDVMRPGLLRSKGWVFERTWSRSWWKDPEAELSRLRARITEAMMR